MNWASPPPLNDGATVGARGAASIAAEKTGRTGRGLPAAGHALHPVCMEPTLETRFDDTFNRLGRATRDAKSAWRTPVLATSNAETGVSARTVVLRAWARAPLSLDLFTDARSRKAHDLAHQAVAELVFWDPRASIQLRAKGPCTLHKDDAAAQRAMAGLTARARGDYARALPPGSAADAPETARDLAGDIADNFLLIRLWPERLDRLDIKREGHERALFRLENGAWAGTWSVP